MARKAGIHGHDLSFYGDVRVSGVEDMRNWWPTAYAGPQQGSNMRKELRGICSHVRHPLHKT